MWREETSFVIRIMAASITMKARVLSVIHLSHLAAMSIVVTMLPRCRLDLRSGGESQP
jgi:hypothetical protein